MKTPPEVHITIEKNGWTLTQMSVPGQPYNIYPDQFAEDKMAHWTIGPIEVARIIERLGIQVKVTIERTTDWV